MPAQAAPLGTRGHSPTSNRTSPAFETTPTGNEHLKLARNPRLNWCYSPSDLRSTKSVSDQTCGYGLPGPWVGLAACSKHSRVRVAADGADIAPASPLGLASLGTASPCSIQAVEQFSWCTAQTLAKAGYVVLTTDPQGQGQSDTFGEGPDRGEGFPAQSDERPFFDGAQDAVNCFFSTKDHPYRPVESCSPGTLSVPRGPPTSASWTRA